MKVVQRYFAPFQGVHTDALVQSLPPAPLGLAVKEIKRVKEPYFVCGSKTCYLSIETIVAGQPSILRPMVNQGDPQKFAKSLSAALTELKQAYPKCGVVTLLLAAETESRIYQPLLTQLRSASCKIRVITTKKQALVPWPTLAPDDAQALAEAQRLTGPAGVTSFAGKMRRHAKDCKALGGFLRTKLEWDASGALTRKLARPEQSTKLGACGIETNTLIAILRMFSFQTNSEGYVLLGAVITSRGKPTVEDPHLKWGQVIPQLVARH